MTFLPEFVFSLGSPAHDHAFLLPFRAKVRGEPQVLRTTDPQAGPVYRALAELLPCFFERPHLFQAGCKAMLLRVLYHLARRFHNAELAHSEFLRQQERAGQLKKLLAHVEAHYAERLPLAEAAKLAGMSPSRFTKLFKSAAGMSFVQYVSHVRLSQAARLLREGTQRIADIAVETGFVDQSYLVRKFRKHFGQSPLESVNAPALPGSRSPPMPCRSVDLSTSGNHGPVSVRQHRAQPAHVARHDLRQSIRPLRIGHRPLPPRPSPHHEPASGHADQ